MVVEHVPDEYYERYRRIGHEELYRMLRAGSPAQVATLAATWRSTQDTLAALAAALRLDLDRLRPSWTGQASDEFQYRLGLITTYAQKLADESDAIRTGLALMADALASAQRQAEQPEALVSAFAEVGILGSELGMAMTDDERRRSHERVVLLVAQLAAEYGAADRATWPAEIPAAPADLPQSGLVASSPGVVPPPGGGSVSTGLAAAADLAGSPESGLMAPRAPEHLATAPAATMGGGHTSTVLSGLPASHVVGHAPSGGGGGGAGGGYPMAPVAGGPAMAGRLADGQPAVPLGSDDDLAWHTSETLDWHGDTTAPPAVLGDD